MCSLTQIRPQPPFFFRIDEIVERGVSRPQNDGNIWRPSTRRGDNACIPGGASGKWWYCDGQGIRPMPGLPANSVPYKTFSAYYCGGFGFWILRGDATRPTGGEAWHPLSFDYEETDYSTYLTNAGQRHTLNWTRPDQFWPRMLLPTHYHDARRVTQDLRYGGLTGDLPIFLALLAFSMPPNQLTYMLPFMFQAGRWGFHSLQDGRTDKRGVVVYVYTCPPSYSARSTAEELRRYEHSCYYA
ncbi:hypothetical protein CC80DRAFT_418342 [Byssothecium circinans]|uniref:Uncharacterized protein n=1 Tax=Byssothecium circinans TaxID=147558 RepID=A0A6A5TNU6_9PLEO|nr:hypothetical protein CC80DRAFT_418342 [Byssothecium circinans]